MKKTTNTNGLMATLAVFTAIIASGCMSTGTTDARAKQYSSMEVIVQEGYVVYLDGDGDKTTPEAIRLNPFGYILPGEVFGMADLHRLSFLTTDERINNSNLALDGAVVARDSKDGKITLTLSADGKTFKAPVKLGSSTDVFPGAKFPADAVKEIFTKAK
jgi:hypothetical protein